MAAGLG